MPERDRITHNATLIRICGTAGLVGVLVPVVTDVLSWLLTEDYNPLRNTISDLAAGPHSWLLDLGLVVLAASCLAVALGMWSLRPNAPRWIAAVVAVALVGVTVFIIAQMIEKPESTGHIVNVVAMAVLFALATFLAVPGLRTVSPSRARLSIGIGMAWIVLCPLYWFLTDVWFGVFERALAIMLLVWIGTMAWTLRQSASERPWTPAAA